MDFDFDELKQLATTSPAGFAKRRMELIGAELARCKDIDSARQLQSMIDEQRWRHGAGLRASQDLLESAVTCFAIAGDAARSLLDTIRIGGGCAPGQLHSCQTVGEASHHIRTQRVGDDNCYFVGDWRPRPDLQKGSGGRNTMTTTTTIDNDLGIVRLDGHFSFDSHPEFRDAVAALLENSSIRLLHIDLGGVVFIDSAALRLLLVSRESAMARCKQISLINVEGAVKAVLDIANFQKLFDIRYAR